MALSDSKTDIWKVGFTAIVVFYSFRRHHHEVETIGGMMLFKNLDIIFVLEIDSCESNGVVRFKNGHLEGWFLCDCRVLFIFPSSPWGGDNWRHDAVQESDIIFVLEIDSCESNGVVRLQYGHLIGWFLYDSCFNSFRRQYLLLSFPIPWFT